jgi:hypothetical protein
VSDWVAELPSDDTFTAEDYDNRDKCPNCIQKEREASMAWDRMQELDRALRLACKEMGESGLCWAKNELDCSKHETCTECLYENYLAKAKEAQ